MVTHTFNPRVEATLGYLRLNLSKREMAHTKVILALGITCLYSQHYGGGDRSDMARQRGL